MRLKPKQRLKHRSGQKSNTLLPVSQLLHWIPVVSKSLPGGQAGKRFSLQSMLDPIDCLQVEGFQGIARGGGDKQLRDFLFDYSARSPGLNE